MTGPQVDFVHVSKAFGAVQANRDVSFTIAANSLHGVVGENGAGKSTIMKILYGLYAPDSGEIRIDGSAVKLQSPHEAIARGVGMVHQHFMLVPTLTVWENIILGQEPTRGRLHRGAIIDSLNALQNQYGFSLDLEKRIEDLPVGHQQQVEILKLLYREANILILDEPTAVLTPQEVDTLFEKMRALWKQGKSIVLITHKLREILRFTDTITVMRQGSVVETVAAKDMDERTLAEKIVGRKLATLPPRHSPPGQEAVLQLSGLGVAGKYGKPALDNVSFEIHRGEVVGIAGIEGNGQHELVEVLSGVNRDYAGSAKLLGREYHEVAAYAAKQNGLSIIPPDRHREAVVLDFSLAENFVLGHHREDRYGKNGYLSPAKLAAQADSLMERFDVRPRNAELPMSSLSGGNQQKCVVARELSQSRTDFLLAAHPTRGVDIGAIEFIHKVFLQERDEGAAILLISSELEELLSLADRILVLYEGRVVGQTTPQQTSEAQLGLWMTGATA
ncbi:MAG: ABC transporter ATP-binding protein [Bdellovibrionales bacterium]|nr:ABC transporter ATP-binding protein [Bdellovibrionales bacterium]